MEDSTRPIRIVVINGSVRCCSRSSGPPFGAPPVGQLGRAENQNALAGQYLELADSNFAEVGAGGYDLIPGSRNATCQTLRQGGRSTFNFGIQAERSICGHQRTAFLSLRCSKPPDRQTRSSATRNS